MKMYTSSVQTTKLIELGFEKPKSEVRSEGGIFTSNARKAYSIGELIEMLPKYTEIKSQQCCLDISPTKNKWYVYYENIVFRSLAKVSEIELIDALYDMCVKLKEEGVI